MRWSEVTSQDLIDGGVPRYIVHAVETLTKKPGQSYLEYILDVSCDVIARDVKIADIKHNMSCFDKPKGSLYSKYELALYILQEDL